MAKKPAKGAKKSKKSTKRGNFAEAKAPKTGKDPHATKKQAGVGKKGKAPKKRNWRKTDVADVEEAMEDERLVARLKRQAAKGPMKDDIDTEALFTVDTKGSCQGLSASSRREVARAKLFPAKGPNIGMSAYEEAKIAKADSQVEANRRQKRPAPEPTVFDLWSAPTKAEAYEKQKADQQVGAFNIRTLGKPKPIYTPRTMHQKASSAPAVVPAHEGQSVNPSSDAFEDLACMAAAKQLAVEQEAKDAERRSAPITAELRDALGADVVDAMDDETKLAEYRKLFLSADSTADTPSEGSNSKKAARWKQKSQAQRNREKRQKVAGSTDEQLRQQKQLEKSVGEVGNILKEMKEEEEERKTRKQYRLALRQKRKDEEASSGVMDKTTRLGRTRFHEEELIVPDSNAAKSGLRSMPIKASAVKERLASIVGRGLLPAPQDSKHEAPGRKKSSLKFRKKQRFMSPLLRDNLLMR
eukprot:TRINITY_DN20409_c0_g1_i1.p1 TRINITY_DN20409_c0_g1~~TRINITY_DN20409_c0_g1_i1.p1  ORF type:complete len:470 (+),score=116.45 TRINITY_DN20409_c0_g1_i1:28-1437(+)